jgi:hypothetical protein
VLRASQRELTCCLPFPSCFLSAFMLVSFLSYSSALKMEAKCRLTFNGLHGVMFQKIELTTVYIVLTAVSSLGASVSDF